MPLPGGSDDETLCTREVASEPFQPGTTVPMLELDCPVGDACGDCFFTVCDDVKSDQCPPERPWSRPPSAFEASIRLHALVLLVGLFAVIAELYVFQ